ncbi:MAG: hypothetical protein KC635_06670, partial [Myxococcales bacterium]|nr:hypothetical protein [Myxococcales bacterium]
ALALGGLAPPAARASEGGTQESLEYVEREGILLGVEVGTGGLICSGTGCGSFLSSGSFDLHAGAMLGPKLAALLDIWWMFRNDADFTISQGIMTLTMRFWPIDHLWLAGGLGAGRTGHEYDGTARLEDDQSQWVMAFHAAVGWEPLATEYFGLSLAFRYGTGFWAEGDSRVHSLALTVGLDFY